MPIVKFLPSTQEITVDPNTKLLAAANRAKVPIRFGCAACRCGTCGVAIANFTNGSDLLAMQADEQALLNRMGLKTDGSIRLACRARINSGLTIVDLDFQNTYSPDEDFEEENAGGVDDGV